MKTNPNVVCEQVGNDVLVLDPENLAVVTLTGDSAGVVKRLLAGDNVSDTEPGVDELLSQGIIVSTSLNGLSRRSLLTTGAAVGAGGIFALSLPAAANSSSTAEVTGPEKLDAPQFRALHGDLDEWGPPGDWDYDEWLKVTEYGGNFVEIQVQYIANFDESLIYEFSVPGSEDTFYVLEFDSGFLELDESLAASLGLTGDLAKAFLRVRNTDGLVSDVTEFFFAAD